MQKMSLAVQSVVQQMFCGDEVKGCVVDLGDTQCRFGFAGQDVPRYRFRSDVGIIEGESASRKTGVSSSSSKAMDLDDNEADGSTRRQG